MPDTACIDGDNASCEVNSFPAGLPSPHPKWNASDYQCSICYELLLNPVVGSCGHDFCKHCIEEWKVSRQLVGQAVLCPICRAVLLPSADQSFGVCIRLRETIEKLFPEQVTVRRRQTTLATQARKCAGGGNCGPTPFPLPSSSPSSSTSTSTSGISSDTSSATTATTSNTTSSNSTDPTTATATTSSGSPAGSLSTPSGGGGAPGPPTGATPYPLLDLEFLSRAAEQYRELSLLVSAITSVPAPPAAVVQAFTHAAASMADHVSSRTGSNGTLSTTAAPLQPHQAAELAQLFMSSGAALTSTAAALQQQQQQQHLLQQQHSYAQLYRQDSAFTLDPAAAAAAVATMSGPDAGASAALAAQYAVSGVASSGGGGAAQAPSAAAGRNNGFLEAALTLLTSAAATSTAAGQLRTLVSALHHQQHAAAAADGAMPASTAAGGMLRTTANTVQQLTAEAAAMSHLLRMHHQQQLQAHMQAAAQAQAAVQAQAQAQAQSQMNAQAQAQQLMQLQAAQQQPQVQYLGRYLVSGTVPHATTPLSLQQPQMLIGWANGLAASAATAPVLLIGSSPAQHLSAQQLHSGYTTTAPAAATAGSQQPYATTAPYQQLPYLSVPASAATAAVPAVELYSWGQAAGSGSHPEGPGTPGGSTWSAAAVGGASSMAQGSLCYPLTGSNVRFLGTQPAFFGTATSNATGGGGGGLQPMQMSMPESLPEASVMAAASASSHGLQQRQQLPLRQQTQVQTAARTGMAAPALTHTGL